MDIQKSFQEFISDPQLSKLIDIYKKTDNIFDIIDHHENQHSEILKWLFDPREGHGQGESIFKDFLIAAYWATKNNGNYNVKNNEDFFEIWTPSKIARTGFNSMVIYREFVLSQDSRLDLMIVDFDNKLIVVVENKRGAKLTDEQIERYYEEVNRRIRKRPVFKGFLTAHVVLDQYYEPDEDLNKDAPRKKWAFLDYSWLESSARRAEYQLSKGNVSSALVVSYCQSQSDYVSKEKKEAGNILAQLANDYTGIIKELSKISLIDLKDITSTMLDQSQGDMWLFAKHYSDLVLEISEKTYLSYMGNQLNNEFSQYDLDLRFSKSRLYFLNPAWIKLMDDDKEFLPIIVNIWQINNANEEPKFNVSVHYMKSMLDHSKEEKINNIMKKIFPELQKGRQSASLRRLGMQRNLSKVDALKASIDAFKKLENALREV